MPRKWLLHRSSSSSSSSSSFFWNSKGIFNYLSKKNDKNNQKGHFHKAHWKSVASCGKLIHFLLTFLPKTAFFFTMTGTLTMKENVEVIWDNEITDEEWYVDWMKKWQIEWWFWWFWPFFSLSQVCLSVLIVTLKILYKKPF